jgi:TonB-linked SusC/RagA family outer membrane protein
MKGNPKEYLRAAISVCRRFMAVLPVAVFCIATAQPLHAQQPIGEKKVTLDMPDASLPDVLGEIKRQTGVIFVFNSDDLNNARRVRADYSNATITTVLDGLLRNRNLEYKLSEDYVVISRMDASSVTAPPVARDAGRQTVTGTITDENGLPIPGANVWIKETAIGTATNADGQYSLSFEGGGNILSVKYLGYNEVEYPIDRPVIDVRMAPAAETIEDVVVVGYGIQKKESVIGAISTVNADDLKIPTSKLSTGLAGQLAGIVSVQRSGEPGSGAEFWIRGISTFGAGKTPLVLVDGIERSMDYVDPDDIQSFSILKDATATAVYGVRGANGVIIITTRRGTNSRPKITVKAETGMTGPTQMPKMANSMQFAEMYNEAFAYQHGEGSTYYSQAQIDMYRNGTDPDLYPNVDWINSLYKDFSHNYRVNASVTGGGNIARYYISGGIYQEGSIFSEDSNRSYDSSIRFKKFSFRSNVDVNLSPSTVLNINLANIYEKKNSPGSSTGDIWSYTFNSSPNVFPIRFSDGSLSAPDDSGFNPYNLMTQSGYTENYWNTAQALVGVTQDFSDILTEGLVANVKFSWDAHNTHTLSRTGTPPLFVLISRERNPDGSLQLSRKNPTQSNTLSYSNSAGGNRTFYLEGSLAYNRVFGDVHRVGGLLLYNQKEQTIIAGSSEAALPYRDQGLAARLTYSYDDRYFAEFNFGYNGSENFAPGNRFGFFPAGAVGWLVSEEKFWQPIKKVVSLLKLKTSYGLVGNDDIENSRRFIYRETINTGSSGYTFGGSNIGTGYGGDRLQHIANPDVSWEKSYKLNTGFEISFINRINLNVDYFVEQRRGIFMARKSIPGFAGFSTMPYSNNGKVDNRGIDASLEWDQRFGEFTVSARGNFTYNRNKIIDDDQIYWAYPYLTLIGKPINQQFGLISEGLFQSEEEIANWPRQTFSETVRVGDIKYRDVNSDGQIDTNDRVAIGRSSMPEIVYGFGASVRWRGIDLSVFFQGLGNTTFFMSGTAVRPFYNDNLNRAGFYEDVYHNRWTLDNPDPNAKFPRLDIGNNTNNYQNSTYWQRSGSFLRLKNAEIGYTLPRNFTSKMRLDYVRIYVSGLNLLTFAPFKMWDPEIGNGQGQGYPPNRVFNIGLTINI